MHSGHSGRVLLNLQQTSVCPEAENTVNLRLQRNKITQEKQTNVINELKSTVSTNVNGKNWRYSWRNYVIPGVYRASANSCKQLPRTKPPDADVLIEKLVNCDLKYRHRDEKFTFHLCRMLINGGDGGNYWKFYLTSEISIPYLFVTKYIRLDVSVVAFQQF